jgi:hypothetical protein
MKSMSRFVLLLSGLLNCVLPGCGRDLPPEILKFVPPVKQAVVDSTVPEVVKEPSAPADVPKPKPKPAPVKQAVVEAAPPPAPVVEAKPEKKEPTILGTWTVVEMSHNGQSQPMPPGMQMTLTFEEGGSVTMSMSGDQMPEARTTQGTYSLTDGQISLTVGNDTQTGTCSFEGENRLVLDFTKAEMVLTR